MIREIKPEEYSIIERAVIKIFIEPRNGYHYTIIKLSKEYFVLSALIVFEPLCVEYLGLKPLYNDRENNFNQKIISDRLYGKNFYTN